jgi:diguanylate cyclase (GGDEF)-like protein/PAS domain S-box-containing protein
MAFLLTHDNNFLLFSPTTRLTNLSIIKALQIRFHKNPAKIKGTPEFTSIQKSYPKSPAIFLALYIPGILVALTELFLRPEYGSFHKLTGAILLIEDSYIFSYALLAIIIIWYWGKKAISIREKKQAQIFALSGLATVVLSVINEILAYKYKTVPPMNHIISLLFAMSIWYVIVQYKFPGLTSLIKMNEIVDNVTDLVFLVDCDGKIVDYNQKICQKLEYSKDELLGYPLNKVISKEFTTILNSINQKNYIYYYDSGIYCTKKSGDSLPVSLHISLIKDKAGDQVGLMLVCQDRSLIEALQSEISNRIQKEEQLQYINSHDSTTGLYNRTRFEQELISLEKQNLKSAGIMICDIDGLKLTNDTLGHNTGDQLLIASAKAIRAAFHGNEIVARIGGDEFGVLVPRANIPLFNNAYQEIKEAVQQFNQEKIGLHLSISTGYALANEKTVKIIDLFMEADNNMYKEKLNHIDSTRNGIIQALMKTLEVRDFITEGHTRRIKNMAVGLGNHMHLPEPAIINLLLLSQFHDIGKIGIPDRILFKPGPLTSSEMKEMQKHCEIGYRIAISIKDLYPIANLILRHHERWDGHGYPLGLKGNEIPLECRIISVVDAFDAMTNNRPYRKAMPVRDAVIELGRNSGTQFDPEIVESFIKLIHNNSNLVLNFNG